MTNEADLVPELTLEACSAAVSLLPKEGSLEYIAGCVYDLASDAVVESVKRNHSTGAAGRQREGFDIMRQVTVPYIEDNLIWGGPGPIVGTESALNESYAAAYNDSQGAEPHVLEYAYQRAYEDCRHTVLESLVYGPERMKAWSIPQNKFGCQSSTSR
jgi:hypothetical protein